MSDLKGVIIKQGDIGPSVLGSGDEISGLIIEAVAATGLALNTPVTIFKPKDAENLGITAQFDIDNNVVCHRHISEFYRMAGEGTKLFIMLVAIDTTMVEMLKDETTALARKIATFAKGSIKQLGLAVNPSAVATLIDQLPEDVYNAIPLAQGFYNWADDNSMPLQIFLDGREFGGTSASAADLRAIENVEAEKVSICIGQDFDYYESRATTLLKKSSDIGTMLGTAAGIRVNQNIGENETLNLTDATKAKWLEPALTNHVKNTAQFEDLQTLEDKGYIFGVEYDGLAGVRWNNDHTCTPIIIDAEGNINQHTISYGRTFDKAKRQLRIALLPKVKTAQPVDPATGKLPPGVVKYFDGIGNGVFSEMLKRSEISLGVTVTDPTSDLVIEKILRQTFKVVPYGYANEIQGTLNLKRNV